MAKDETKRIRPVILQEDRDALSAIKGYKTPVYKPANDDYTLDKLVAAQTAMVDAREWEVQQQTEADKARDATVAAEWAFHNMILDAKNQVKAQYGEDSDEYAGLGLKKKSERDSPGRPAAPAED
jgi:hypothetical protein